MLTPEKLGRRYANVVSRLAALRALYRTWKEEKLPKTMLADVAASGKEQREIVDRLRKQIEALPPEERKVAIAAYKQARKERFEKLEAEIRDVDLVDEEG